MSPPGNLYVTMQPKPGLSLDQFHEWYNNEHGPTRLRLPQIFSNGLRYKATDAQEPTYLAAYDVTSMPHLETETYLTLRANRSPREAETIGQVDVKRYFWDLVHSNESDKFVPFEKLTDEEAEGLQTTAVTIELKDVEGAAEEYQKWLVEEHIPMLAKVPGWLRSRAFKTSYLEGQGKTTFLALHDYAKENGQGGTEHKASMDTPWRTKVFDNFVASKGRRTYSLFYVFGPAPRELEALSKLPSTAAFTSPDSKQSTTPGPNAAINSYITTSDSLVIPYRLEGNPDPKAPTIAFSNSLLTSLHMWDPLVEILKRERPEFRILRYDTRGRHSVPQPPVAATVDRLADDTREVLDALRITKLHTLIGVSMGGVTTLNFAIKYPERLQQFIASDFNPTSSAANTQAWKDRTALAEEDNGKGIEKLAGQTVQRWFHPSTNAETVKWMTEIVVANDVEGFKYSNTALWDYDLKPKMGGCKVPGLFVVGEEDAKGALVKAMDACKGLLGDNGAELKIVPQTGHLPMAENPQAFWEVVKEFL
ncbi:3-oxoadipate enol-lactonase [Fusarium denticulatum]|uniref:3-oxoadipate enol-lactonase n=1 Tax=Fusarium denticulatum TaxID=48507 RepID=A0A8H5WLX3_9HYPO|nr:3-oxoadipate enol-lactonase [Fusarium denticulatum]